MFLIEFIFPKKINREEDSQLLILDKNKVSLINKEEYCYIIDKEEYYYVLVFDKRKMSWIDRFFCFIFRKEIVYCEKKVEFEVVKREKPVTAYEYLKKFKDCGYLPMSIERPCTEASNSEIKRWLKNSAVIINGKKPKPDDEIEFPITELVYFSKGKSKTTVI